MNFEAYQSNPSSFFVQIILNVFLTALFYGAGPVLFSAIRKSPVSIRFYRNFCVLYTIFVYLLFSVLYLLAGISGVPNMTAAVIWGVIFYRVCRKKLQKKEPEQKVDATAEEPRQIVEVYRSKFRMPDQQVNADKPGKRVKAVIAILSVALVFSLCINGYQAVCMQNKDIELEKLESDVSVYKVKTEQLQASYDDAKERADILQEKSDFLSNKIGLIVEGSSYYHTYSCQIFQRADTFWAHNVEYCEFIGYEKCPICGFVFD